MSPTPTRPTQTDIRNALFSAEHYINNALYAPLEGAEEAIAQALAIYLAATRGAP